MKKLVVVALVACGAPMSTATQTATTTTLSLGDATLTPLPRWTFEQHGELVTFSDPDRAVTVTIVANAGADPVAAIAAAWKRVEPGFAIEGNDPEDVPDTTGWDSVASIEYKPPAAQHRIVYARWREAAGHRIVVLVDGDAAAVDRREAEISVLEGSVHVPGMHEQTLGARRAIDPRPLDAFVDRAARDLQIPGAAIAVVDNGRVVYERTLGVRSLADPAAPVTVDTRFLIASITKPMTTLMEAALVDAHVVGWDTPVVSILPSFAVGDPDVTRELRLWHMSCACTGMPRQDLEDLFEWTGVTPEMRIAALRTMKPTTKLGETFQYSNLMVAAGGFIAAHAYAPDRPLADAYAAAMHDKVFAPIGMSSSTLDFATVARGDHAVPHALAIDGSTRAMPLEIERGVEPIAPAGGVWTTLRDMERFVETELADGVAPDGRRVVSAANLAERMRVRIRSSATGGYALGIGIGTYQGLRRISHDGGSMGMGTTMFMLPTAHLGIIIFTNVRNGGGELPFNLAVTRRIVELAFDGTVQTLADKKLAAFTKARVTKPRAASADHAWVAPLVGTYHDPALGNLVLRATETGADLDAGEWHVAVDREVEADGTVKLVVLDPPFAGGAWIVAPGPQLQIAGYPGYSFVRRDPAH